MLLELQAAVVRGRIPSGSILVSLHILFIVVFADNQHIFLVFVGAAVVSERFALIVIRAVLCVTLLVLVCKVRIVRSFPSVLLTLSIAIGLLHHAALHILSLHRLVQLRAVHLMILLKLLRY